MHYGNYEQMRCQPSTRLVVEIPFAGYANAVQEAVDTFEAHS